MATIAGTRDIKVYRGEYSFAIDGGAIGAIPLRAGAGSTGPIPAGSVILEAFLDVTTLFTTGTAATLALSVEGANDLVSATVVSGAPYSTTGIKATIPVFTAATMIKTTAERAPTGTIAVGTITAGVLALVIFYV